MGKSKEKTQSKRLLVVVDEHVGTSNDISFGILMLVVASTKSPRVTSGSKAVFEYST